jgi:hypothetical protein
VSRRLDFISIIAATAQSLNAMAIALALFTHQAIALLITE